jgi:hypothetical protein
MKQLCLATGPGPTFPVLFTVVNVPSSISTSICIFAATAGDYAAPAPYLTAK